MRGGWWTIGNLAFALIILVLLDWIVPEDTSHPEPVADWYADLILIIHVIINTIAIGTLIYGIQHEILTGTFLWLAIFSTGINSGQSGIIVAHELIHRKSKFLRLLGIWNLHMVLYTHFRIEHVYGHHKWVATFKDPATAKLNESIYHFIPRTIPKQFISAFRIEWERNKRKGKNPVGPQNYVINTIITQLLILVAIFYQFGSFALIGFVVQAFTAIVLLELVNYIEHYGLLRREGDPFVVELAWNTDILSSRWFLIELVRHSDHHLKSFKPYQTLISYRSDGVPTLPSGYWGVFYLVFIPSIWRKIIHPRIPKSMVDLFYELTKLRTGFKPDPQIAGVG